MKEHEIELDFLRKLQDLKYEYRSDIRDLDALKRNFRNHFESLNRVRLTDAEFSRLLEEIITPDVYSASRMLREKKYIRA